MKLKLFVLIIALLSVFSVNAQNKKGTESVNIAVSMDCNSCKNKVENDLAYVKGVVDIDASVETKIVKVVYKPKKTNPQVFIDRIKKLGLKAYIYQEGDEVKF